MMRDKQFDSQYALHREDELFRMIEMDESVRLPPAMLAEVENRWQPTYGPWRTLAGRIVTGQKGGGTSKTVMVQFLFVSSLYVRQGTEDTSETTYAHAGSNS